MSLSETYLSRKKLLADNLKSMGVSSVDETDGLTTLINAVLNIEPSIGGLDLDTSLITTTTQEIIGLGESIILTSTLRASYDDTTVVDVDLSGVLTGATVKFYNGTTLLGTAITDLNGIATYTYTPSQLGNFTFNAVFEGTENFTNCNSNNVNVTVINPPTSLVLQADKSILSSYDNDNCTLTATLYDNNNTPMEGLRVVFKNGDIVLATITTDSGGVATYTYNSQGVGDVTITAECMNLQETYSIQDCFIFDENGFSYTSNSTADTTYPTGWDYGLPSTSNFEMEFDYNNPPNFRLYFAGMRVTSIGDEITYGIGFSRDAMGKLIFSVRDTSTHNTACQSINSGNNHYKVVFHGNSVNVWVNDVQQVSNRGISWWNAHYPYCFNWAIWAKGTGNVTNIKIKPL